MTDTDGVAVVAAATGPGGPAGAPDDAHDDDERTTGSVSGRGR
jgi:hypothetical protein